MIDIRANLYEPAREGEETAEIYRREARALFEMNRASEAATKLLDAAYANDRDEAAPESIVRDLLTAVELASKEAWIASSARRLLVKHAVWTDALRLLEHECQLSTSHENTVACALEAAAIHWIVMNQPDQAAEWVKVALNADPNHIGALYLALWLETTRRHAHEAAQCAENIAKILGSPEERAVLYTYAANIQFAQNDDYAAMGLYQAAIQADKNALYALLPLAALNEKNQKFAEAAQNWYGAASVFDDKACAGEFYARAAAIWALLGELGKAANAFDEAFKRIEPDDNQFVAAIEVFERLGNDKRAIELEQWRIQKGSPERQAAVWNEMARIALQGGDLAVAENALDQADAAGANDLFTFDWRCALCERTQNYAKMTEILKKAIESEAHPARLEYLTWRLARAQAAAGCDQDAAETMREHPARIHQWRLSQILDGSDHHEAHVRALDAWLNATSDEKMRAALRSRLVNLLCERLNRPEIAYQYIRNVQDDDQSFTARFERLILLQKLDQKAGLLTALQQFASATTDREDARMWLMEAAVIAAEIHEQDTATQILQTLHDAYPTYVPAILLLHDLAIAHDDLPRAILANAWRADVFPEQQAQIFTQNAWYAQCLGDQNGTLAWFERAASVAPLDGGTAMEYARRLRAAGNVQKAVDCLQASLDGKILNTKQSDVPKADVDDAIDLLIEGLDHQNTDVHDGVENDTSWGGDDLKTTPQNIDENSEETQNLNKNLTENACDDELRLANLKSICELRACCLGCSDDNAERQKRIFEASPTFRHYIQYVIAAMNDRQIDARFDNILKATAQVELPDEESKNLVLWLKAELIMGQGDDTNARVDLMLRSSLKQSYGIALRAEILRQLRQKSDEDAASWLETYAASTNDKWIATEVLREASLRNLWVEHNFDAVRRTSLAAFRQTGNDWRTLWELEHFADISEDYQALGVLRERMAQLEIEPLARQQALKNALAPYVDEELNDHAVRVAQACLKQDAHDFTALLTLAQLAEDAQNSSRLAYVADRLAEASVSRENRLCYGLWAANLWHETGSDDQAFSSLTSLLANDPTSAPAIAKAEQLLGSLKQWDKLSVVYVRAISALPEGRTQIELLRKQASLLADKLDDPAGASIALSRILTQSPDDLEALAQQTELLARQSRWAEAVETLELRIKYTEDPQARRLANIKLAEILIHQVADMDRARRLLRRHLTQFDHDIEALRLLYEIACSERNWLEARLTLDEICQQRSHLLVWATLAYTRIAREAEWTNDVRVVYERNAIAIVLSNRDDFEDLVNDYKTHGELERLIRVAKYDLEKSQDPETISQYRGCVAALYVANAQHCDALKFLSGVISEEKQTDWAYLARAQALFSAGQLDSAAAEFRRTLTFNLAMNKAYAPFLDVLHQLGDDVAWRAVNAFVEHRLGHRQKVERIIQGNPRGFFNIENIAIENQYVEAFQYLRLMTPYIYPIYERPMQVHALDQKHWAVTRCRQLFGQNFEVKPLYFAKLSRPEACVRLTDPPAIIVSHELLAEQNAQFDFWAAYAMHQATSGGAIMDAIDDDEADALFMALCQPEPETIRAQALKKIIAKRLPRSDRKLFKDGVPFKAPNWSDFRAALSTRAACIAAVISGAPACALAAFPNNEALQRFILSDTYVRLMKLYFS